MKPTRYVVIPDIHNRVGAAEAVASRYPDHTKVFLGDYFDDYRDNPCIAKLTADWLRWSVYQPDRIHLMGNHDLPYIRPTMFTTCPGWTRDKYAVVNKVMLEADWARLELLRIIQLDRPLILSHAGLTLASIHGVADANDVEVGGRFEHLRELSVADHLEEINMKARNCEQAIMGGWYHSWLAQGRRMGRPEAAGPFWLDMRDHHPVNGIDQIVGHTLIDEPVKLCLPNATTSTSDNWFIDTASRHAVLIEDGKITPICADTGGPFTTEH